MKVLSGVLLVCGLIMMVLFIGSTLSLWGTLIKQGSPDANSPGLDILSVAVAMHAASAFLLLYAASVVNRIRL